MKKSLQKGSGNLLKIRFMEISAALLCILLSGILWGNMCAGFLAGALEITVLCLSVCMYAFETASDYMIKRRLYRDQVKNVMQSMASVIPVSVLIAVIMAVICLFSAAKLSELFCASTHGIFPYVMIAPAIALLGSQGAFRIYLSRMGDKKGVKRCCIIGTAAGTVSGIIAGFFASDLGGKVGALLRTDDVKASYTAAGVCAGISLGALISLFGLLVVSAKSKRNNKELAEEGMSLVIDKRRDVIKNLRYGIPVCMIIPLVVIADHIVYRLSLGGEAGTAALIGGWGSLGGFCLAIFGLFSVLMCVPFLEAWKEVIAAIMKKDTPTARTRLSGIIHLEFILVIPVTFWLMASGEELTRLFLRHGEEGAGLFFVVIVPLIIPATACMINSFLLSGLSKNGILMIDLVLAAGLHTAVLIITSRSTGAVTHSIILAWYVFILILLAMTMFEICVMLNYRQDWYRGIFSTVIAAGVGILPAVAVNALLTELIGEILTMLVSLVFSVSVYLVCLVLIRGLTSYELERLPLGEYLLPIAERFERRDGE